MKPPLVAKPFAFAPVAFAMTEGPGHKLVYSNPMFRRLQSAGEISVGRRPDTASVAGDLTPVLDRVFQSLTTVRDELLAPSGNRPPSWSCTVWPVTDVIDVPDMLVIEVRDVKRIEAATVRNRALAGRLLLASLHEQDIARDAVGASDRAQFLARASRDLAMSLDENATRDTVRRLALPRAGSWCVVDLIESNGSVHRLAVVHPDPDKRALIGQLEDRSPVKCDILADVMRNGQPTVLTHESREALIRAVHGQENLSVFEKIGFGSLLIVPLIVRARVQGAITYISSPGDPPFSPEEISIASDLAARCAMALDNARLYREADALRRVAELADQSKSEFLSSMSHELRTPLNVISAYTQLIDMGIHGPVTEPQRVALGRINANQQHLLTLITQIISYTRIGDGHIEYTPREVSLVDALADVADMLSVAVAEKGLSIEVQHDQLTAVAWADPDRVRQILVNLVMNAVKYTPKNRSIITLSAAGSGDLVCAQVSDSGVGIPAEKLEAIFAPFVQLTAGIGDRDGGVGLGLAISRDLARAMNGDLTVESTIGVGSRFTFWLPAARARPKVERSTGG